MSKSPNLATPDEPTNGPALFAPPPALARPPVGYQSNDALAVNTRPGGAGSIPQFDERSPFARPPVTVPGKGV